MARSSILTFGGGGEKEIENANGKFDQTTPTFQKPKIHACMSELASLTATHWVDKIPRENGELLVRELAVVRFQKLSQTVLGGAADEDNHV
ncbi:hypothetical protein llap_2058 [Limosa lapponica baueri]|uniref:Uncharacterized protein n=1 Tax=Limosa lapponica baueri TaxID=1758121 RepID=A0A2I0UNN2_LIMLA|nr:hypothetical protein llap_2058 [Limosa lapponica baueri]